MMSKFSHMPCLTSFKSGIYFPYSYWVLNIDNSKFVKQIRINKKNIHMLYGDGKLKLTHPHFALIYEPFPAIRHKMSLIHTFSAQIEFHLLCSTSPTIITVPFPKGVLERQMQEFCSAIFFFYVTPVSSNAEWMIHVLKQSMLTYIFDCLLLVRYILLYQYRFEQQTCIKEKKWKKKSYI